MRQSSLIWDRTVSRGSKQSVSYETEQSHTGQSRLIWGRGVSHGTEQSHKGKSSLIWDRAVTYGTEQSKRSLIWDGVVSSTYFNILHNFVILELVHRNSYT